MHRKIISTVLSASIVVTSITAQPAQAGSDDLAKWIAGLAAVAIIGAAIADKNRDKRKATVSHAPKPYPRGKVLPGQCLIKSDVHGQTVRGFSRHCLRRNHVNVQQLPRECAVRLRESNASKGRIIYTGRCLHRYGYRLASN